MTLGNVMSAISIGLGKVSLVATAVGKVFTAINTIQTIFDIITLISSLADGGLAHQIKTAWDATFSSLSSSTDPYVSALFTDEFWTDSAQSWSRSSQRILRYMINPAKTSLAKDILGRIIRAQGDDRPRIVIQSPIPYLVPIPAMYIIGIPGKIRLGPVKIGLAVQLGGGSTTHHGQVLGFAIQHRTPTASVSQMFRQDYGPWHQPIYGGTTLDFEFQDRASRNNFHYHVKKKLP
jgi:hypothetical protein